MTVVALHGVPLTAGQEHRHPDAGASARVAVNAAEAGEAAFAAIKEMLELLDRDPATDWSRVDLDALRGHLVDMHRVLIESRVVKNPLPDGVEMLVTGEGDAIKAIQTMVGNHAGLVTDTEGLVVRTTPTATGVRLQITARDGESRTVQRIRALGFAGFMALGDHHRVHHEMIARGRGAEAHIH